MSARTPKGLGPQGEAAWRRFEAVRATSPKGAVVLLASRHARALEEVRLRLGDNVATWNGTDDAVTFIRQGAPRGSVAWLGGPALRAALPRLNGSRDHILRAGVHVVLALDVADLDAWAAAPDLRSRVALDVTLPVPPGREPLTWLHLSDLHFGSEREELSRIAFDALVRDLRDPRAEIPKPDLLFVTGDIAATGRPEEYTRAAHFLQRLADVAEINLRTSCYVVPGNHDVDRKRADTFLGKAAVAALRRETTAEGLHQALDSIGRTPEDLRVITARQDAFFRFVDLLGLPSILAPDRPWWGGVAADVRGWNVGILCLNSAWTCQGREDARSLLVGRPQVRELLESTRNADLRVALVHHPASEWAEADTSHRLLQEQVDFLLRGHLHDAELGRTTTPDGTLATFATRAVWAGHDWKNGFLTVTLLPDADEAEVRAFSYGGGIDGFWRADVHAYASAPTGRWRLPLPEALRGGRAPETAAEGTWSALRKQTCAVYGGMRFVGLPVGGRLHNAGLAEAFVPTRLTPEPRGLFDLKTGVWFRSSRAIDLPEFLGRLGCAVILGPPGSGKSTLCQALAVWASGGLDLGTPATDVAFLLRLRDLGGRTIVEALVDEVQTRLQVPLLQADVEAAVDGGALVLLDGMDEAGSEESRAAAREQIEALAARFPAMRLVVTSRPVGYERVALGKAFERYTLDPFDDAEQERFVRAWYAGREPTDPIARDRGARELLDALEAVPSVKEMARNPLLATLIAMVHRTEARLPGQRADLLNLTVRLLLDTWVSGRRRFDGLSVAQQRELLEDLALRMQRERAPTFFDEETTAGLVISRRELEIALAELVSKRGWSSEADELARVWGEHLVANTGLLVEDSPGQFRFLHLLLQEYLAGRALMRGGDDAVVAAWEGLTPDQHWEEVLILGLGSEANRTALTHRVAAALGPRESEMILRLALEEVDLPEDVVRKAAERAWGGHLPVLRLLHRFSRRHHTLVRDVIRQRLYLGHRPEACLRFPEEAEWALRQPGHSPELERAALWDDATSNLIRWIPAARAVELAQDQPALFGPWEGATDYARAISLLCALANGVWRAEVFTRLGRTPVWEAPRWSSFVLRAGQDRGVWGRSNAGLSESFLATFGKEGPAFASNAQYDVDDDPHMHDPFDAQTESPRALPLVQIDGTWPSSPSLRAFFDAPPPEDWLDLYLWHILHAIDAPPGDEHRAAALAALDAGLPAHPELEPLIVHIRELTPRPLRAPRWPT